MFATLTMTTVATMIFSVVVTSLFMLDMNVPWWDVGTELAIICPLIATPPIMYLFLTLIERLNAVNSELEVALSEVKELAELLPVCAWCRKIRDGDGYWSQLEAYLETHTNSSVTHGICPECAEGLHKEIGKKG